MTPLLLSAVMHASTTAPSTVLSQAQPKYRAVEVVLPEGLYLEAGCAPALLQDGTVLMAIQDRRKSDTRFYTWKEPSGLKPLPESPSGRISPLWVDGFGQWLCFGYDPVAHKSNLIAGKLGVAESRKIEVPPNDQPMYGVMSPEGGIFLLGQSAGKPSVFFVNAQSAITKSALDSNDFALGAASRDTALLWKRRENPGMFQSRAGGAPEAITGLEKAMGTFFCASSSGTIWGAAATPTTPGKLPQAFSWSPMSGKLQWGEGPLKYFGGCSQDGTRIAAIERSTGVVLIVTGGKTTVASIGALPPGFDGTPLPIAINDKGDILSRMGKEGGVGDNLLVLRRQ